MPSPFPGMDPYLEDPELWPDVHGGLIAHLQDVLNDRLPVKYVARKEARVYVAGRDDPGSDVRIPDVRIERSTLPEKAPSSGGVAVLVPTEPVVFTTLAGEEIEERYLTIKDRRGNLIAVIEVLSPTNKIAGSAGRTSFLNKRQEVLRSAAHWVEVDFLRTGERVPPTFPSLDYEYRIVLSRADDRKHDRCWPIRVKGTLPVVSIPLASPDPDVVVDLGAVFTAAYKSGAYDRSIDYRKPPVPPLPRPLAGWANRLLRAKGLR